MLLVKLIISFLLLQLVITSPQINLHLTEWSNTNTDDIVLQHTCHVHGSMGPVASRQIIPYCMSEWPGKWNISKNSFDSIFTFAELYKENITSTQLYRWSAPMDMIEHYQFYLNQMFISNSSSTLGTLVYYNCTAPRFGPQCQYSLAIRASSHFSLTAMIQSYYDYQSFELETLTCYTHLQCNRSSSLICLDWSEICDGKVDCIDGMDENNCSPLINSKCEVGEYQCDNGQCIPEIFVNDGRYSFECLDRSDEYRISSMSFQYEYGVPTLKSEDVVCSWRGGYINSFWTKNSLTSSCARQRQSLIERAMFADGSNGISNICLSALKCHSNIPIYDHPLCSNLCQNRTCIQTIQRNCSEMFYYPAVPVAYGHIYFAYTKSYIINSKSMGPIPPEYICYNEQRCGGFDSNRTVRLFNGKTCRRPEDFPLSFGTHRRDWYLDYVLPLYSQLSHCSRMVHDSATVLCNNSTMYHCQNSSKCIPKSYVGDRIRDCDYKDDEEQTTIDELCLTDQSNTFFKCQTTNKCIHRKQVENGMCDCKRNEHDMCDDEDLKLNEMRRKIRFSTICDGFIDLLPIMIDGQYRTDETECEHWSCSNMYTRCNGFWNCPNGIDETDCNPSPLIKCPPHHHICVSLNTKQLMCLPIAKANDGVIDCFGGTDEPTLCPVTNRYYYEKKFYCISGDSGRCIPSRSVCNAIIDCENEDDEQFCNSIDYNVGLNYSSLSDTQKFFCTYLRNTFTVEPAKALSDEPKSKAMISPSSITNQPEQSCHRGLPLQVWLDTDKDLSLTTCLCPPSYYGNRCQYQNQRVSLTLQLSTTFSSEQTPFVLVVSLIDDSAERIIHSYQQLTYLPTRDYGAKFNVYLLYSSRPKLSTKQYSVHIDIYEMMTLIYRGSFSVPLKFPFLPVERIAVKLDIPRENNFILTSSDPQCVHGQCIQYVNDPKHTIFCQCNPGWTGRYCNISYPCTCSSDSLCVGIAANNRSICACPMNKFGSRCLLTHTICQFASSNACENGGVCISSNEYSPFLSPFVCICPKGFSGERCEIPDTKIILSFNKDIVLPLPSFLLFHFIHLIDDTQGIPDKKGKLICANQTSINISWSYSFRLAFVEVSPLQYYLVVNQKIYNQSAVIVRTINPADQCRPLNEIFNETLVQSHLIQRIKYYHLPCQKHLLNFLSCFYDDVYMCVCQNDNDQRLANCFEFNHQTKLDDSDYYRENNLGCYPQYSFNSSTTLTPSGMSSIYACEFSLYLLMLLFCFI